MRGWRPSPRQLLVRGLLALACLQAGAALSRDDSVGNAGHGGQARVAAVEQLLKELDAQNDGSAAQDLLRLRQAGPLPKTASPSLRRIYLATLAQRAAQVEGQQAVEQAALEALQAMVRDEDCQPCRTELLLPPLEGAHERAPPAEGAA